MLPCVYRLKKKEDFRKVYNAGKSYATPYLVIYTIKKENQEKPRIGFSVSKKLGSAVCRNRIKRQLREAARKLVSYIKEPIDIIFIARIKIKGVSFNDVEKNMLTLLKKAGLIDKGING